MQPADIDNLMIAAGMAGELILLFILFRRKLYKEFPIFTTYVAFELIASPVMLAVLHFLHVPTDNLSSNPTYFRVYSVADALQFFLELGLLVEIARSVLQPYKRSLPTSSLVVFFVLVVAGGLVTYVLGGHSASGRMLSRIGYIFDKWELYWAILRIVCFLVIAGFAQMLGIGWKNHVLQLATGLAFYGAADLIVRLAQSKLGTAGVNVSLYQTQYRLLDQFRTISYLSTLIFWSWSFAKKEAQRKEFSPQMAGFLVSIAGAAKKSRSQFGR